MGDLWIAGGDTTNVATMNLLVIGSCTGDKDVRDCPYLPTESDFEDPVLLGRRQAELVGWALPAARLYTGWQHRYMMNGIDLLRRRFGSSACSVKIISAGFGLVDEEQPLVPYEATFQGKRPDWIRKRAGQLGIPQAVRKAIHGYECVIFLLGKEYLLSIHPPLQPSSGQRLVFFTSNRNVPFTSDSTIVPAGKAETRFGAGTVALKGRMFELFAAGLCHRTEMWDSVCSDGSPRTVLKLMENGRGAWAASTT